MIFNMTGSSGGSGAGLNFKIVSSTSEPTSPSENMIWVNTDAEITSWTFNATEPETPSEGMVWFTTTTSSYLEFNALKKNSIQLCLSSAKQYVSGTWLEKTTKSYQNGVWVDLVKPPFYIFKAGEGALVQLKHSAADGVGVTETLNSIEHKCTGANQLSITFTTNAVSLTGYSKLCMRAKCTYAHTQATTGHPPKFGLFSYKPTDYYSIKGTVYPDIAYANIADEDAERTYTVPIPSDVTEAWVAVGGGFSIKIYNIWLE